VTKKAEENEQRIENAISDDRDMKELIVDLDKLADKLKLSKAT
jgi:hypothetical protein